MSYSHIFKINCFFCFLKDFDHFADRRAFNVGKKDKLFGKMLFSLRGEAWRHLRYKFNHQNA